MTAAEAPRRPLLAPGPDLDEIQGRRAGVVSRGLALGIDFGIVLIGYPVIMWGIGIVIGLLNFEEPTYPDLPGVVNAAIYVSWSWGYFVVSWFAAGRTIGQALLGLRVIGRGRRPLGPVRSAVRAWVMFATLFVIGPVWLLLSRSRLAIHDRVAHTQVVFDSARHRTEVQVELTAGASAAGADQPK